MFRTIDEEVIKKQLPDLLEQLEVAGLDTLLTCPFADKIKPCGVTHINHPNKYCQPQRIAECKLLYSKR